MKALACLGLTCLMAAWAAPPAAAQETQLASASTSDAELQNLLAILDQETEIATKTKMNSDFVPGIVTVLQGDELEALGVRTVWEALSLVPGIEAVRDATGAPSVVVRGIDFPFNSGNVKIMVDSVPLTREAAGVNGGVLLIPIEQVERIEVIRGPGSVMYGEFAFMGLVNIVTRHDGDRVFAAGDSNQTGALGAVGTWKGAGGLELSANVAGLRSGDAEISKPHTADERRGYGNLVLRKGGLTLSAQALHHTIDETTAPLPGPRINNEETTWSGELSWAHELSDDFHMTGRADVLDTDLSGNNLRFTDRVYRGSVDLRWDGLENQSWLGSVEYSASRIGDAFQKIRLPPGLQGPPPLEVRDVNRNITSLTLQDRVDLSSQVSVTGGLRYSDYSDIGSRATPRLSLVWRPSDRHILKAQYAEGFRSPTFFELYGTGSRNPSLEFEVNRTTELNYVYRRPRLTGRITLFHSELRDMIFGLPGTPGFDNSRSARSQGVELEWNQQLTPWVKVLANASRADTRDDRGQTFDVHPDVAAPNWIGNLALLAHPTERLLASVRLNHLGPRDSGSFAAYDLLDATLTVRRLFGGLDLRLGVKNLLDDEVVYAFTTPGTPRTFTFGRRTAWAQLSWSR